MNSLVTDFAPPISSDAGGFCASVAVSGTAAGGGAARRSHALISRSRMTLVVRNTARISTLFDIGRRMELSRRLEQLDRIAVRVLDLDLSPAGSGQHFIAEMNPGVLERFDA